MESRSKRKIKSGAEYEHLFPVANLTDETVKKGATVSDTVQFIPKVVKETLSQTEKIAEMLRGSTVSETCKNIWDFVYNHIGYHKDDDGVEQIRSPARAWHDRYPRGVDCDCYTVFISSILTNLKIPHRLRIARYKEDYFQHIYPIVPRSNGRHITIDCVVEYFNYEEPYTEIKDTTMDLQYLSGTDENETSTLANTTDAQDLFGDEEIGKLFKKKSSGGEEKKKGGLKQFVKKAVHITNRVNPATVLLRNGVLASMKLNLMKVAQRLKWAYLTDTEATKRGVDPAKFQKLKKVKEKLENIFFGAGGKPENLKKAILTGKGNKNKEVSGLGDEFPQDTNVFGMHEATPLSQLLGEEIFSSENSESLGELGEPVTAASITASTGALAAIAALLKNIGNIFPKKEKGTEDFENTEKEGDVKNLPSEIEKNKDEMSKMDIPSDDSDSTTSETSKTDGSTSKDASKDANGDPKKEGFWDKNKKWLKPTLWGAGGLSVLALGYHFLTGKKENTPEKSLTGTKEKKKIQFKDKKKPVELM